MNQEIKRSVQSIIEEFFGEGIEFNEEKFIREYSNADLELIEDFFKKGIDEINEDYNSLSDIYFILIGCKLLEIDFHDKKPIIRDYISDLKKDGGYCPVDSSKMEGWRDDIEPEIYSTFYAVRILNFLGIQEDISTEEFVESMRTDNDYFYNNEWSDTIPKYRFKEELRMQQFFAFKMKDEVKEIDNLKEKESYLGSIYFAWRNRRMANFETVIYSEEIDKLKELRKNNGFRNYLLSNKVDEHAGSNHRTFRDQNPPHLFSTFYTLQIIRKQGLDMDYGKENFIEFVDNNKREDGFGVPVNIREFDTPFGSVCTPLENLMVLLSPSLFEE